MNWERKGMRGCTRHLVWQNLEETSCRYLAADAAMNRKGKRE